MKRKNNYNKLINKRLGKLAIPILVAVLSVMGLGMGTLTPTIAETVAQFSSQEQTELEKAKRLYQQATGLHQQGRYSEAIPLMEKILEIYQKILGEEHLETATILNDLGILHQFQGKYSESELFLQQALSIRKQQLGNSHIYVALSLTVMAEGYKNQGRYSEAEPLYQEALAIYKHNNRANHPDTATTLSGLAGLFQAQGKYNEAEPLYQQALAIRKNQLGENHPDTATSLSNLALLYKVQGRYKKAETLNLQALAIYKQELGETHPATAVSLNNLAKIYESQEKYKEVEIIYQQALSIYRERLGENHPFTLTSLNNLGDFYHYQGRYAEAEPLLQQVLAIRKAQLGNNHGDTVISLNNLALLYKSQGRYTEAELLLQQVLGITRDQFGDNHHYTASSLSNLAMIYRLQGRYAEAEPLYQQALVIKQEQFGNNHPATAANLNNLAKLYEFQGRFAEAEPLYQQALAINKEFRGDNSNTARVLENLAMIYRLQGRYTEAESILKEALNIYQKQLGDNHPQIATGLNNLSIIYRLQGRYTEAESILKEALSISKKQLGEDHPYTLTGLNNLAFIYALQKKYKESELLFQQVLAISREKLGNNHPNNAIKFSNLAKVYELQGDISKAINYLGKAIEIQEYNLSENLVAGDERQKYDYMRTVSRTIDGAISLNLQSAPDNPEAIQLALKTILERKGRILDVSTNSLQILRQRTDDPESKQLLTQLIKISTQVSNLTFKKPEDIKNPEKYRQQITELNTKAKELEDKIGRRSAEFRKLSQTITLEAIQQQIPNNSALVEIVHYRPFNTKATQDNDQFGDPRYAVYILFPNGEIKAKDLGEAKLIEDDLIKFRENIADISENGDPQVPIAQLKESARQIDAKLMQPIRELLGDTKTILLSPDAALNLIPFEALVDENNQYLVENYKITYLTSGRDLLRFKDKFPSQQSPIVLADPIYNQEVEEVAQNSPSDKLRSSAFCESGGNIRNFKPLPQTEEEAKTVKQFFPQATILTQSQATENALKQVKKPKILHIATHGFFCELPTTNQSQNANQPFLENENTLLRSGLVLAGVKFGQSAGDDGVLTALETTSLNLVGTKLVVLSACETGKGDITIGEGVYGLRRALVIAGSESQLISLWKVSSNATKDLMVDYYKQLKDGKGRSEALRNVQLEMLKNEDKSHPSYWAGFIASGDWTPMEF